MVLNIVGANPARMVRRCQTGVGITSFLGAAGEAASEACSAACQKIVDSTLSKMHPGKVCNPLPYNYYGIHTAPPP